MLGTSVKDLDVEYIARAKNVFPFALASNTVGVAQIRYCPIRIHQVVVVGGGGCGAGVPVFAPPCGPSSLAKAIAGTAIVNANTSNRFAKNRFLFFIEVLLIFDHRTKATVYGLGLRGASLSKNSFANRILARTR